MRKPRRQFMIHLPGTSRAPSDICCVVDVSGSMGSLATIQNAAGETEAHGLTLLDIVKHGTACRFLRAWFPLTNADLL